MAATRMLVRGRSLLRWKPVDRLMAELATRMARGSGVTGFADLDDLPPVHTFQGGRDLLAADAPLLADRLQQAGNPGTFTLVPGGFHVCVGAFWTTEARAALRAINQLLRPAPVLRE